MIVRHQANPIKYGKLIDSGGENRSIRSNLVQGMKKMAQRPIKRSLPITPVIPYNLLHSSSPHNIGAKRWCPAMAVVMVAVHSPRPNHTGVILPGNCCCVVW